MRQLGVDAARVDGEARALGGEAALGLREAERVPHEVHQVGAVFAVVDGEGRVEADLLGVVAQQPRADAVEGAGPGERVGRGAAAAEHVAGDALDAPRHLHGGAAREGHEQDAARIGAVDDQMRDAVGERVGLARAGAGDDEQRRGGTRIALADAMLDGAPLLRIELFEMSEGHRRSEADSRFVHKQAETSFRGCCQRPCMERRDQCHRCTRKRQEDPHGRQEDRLRA